jgi:hypothetical protein
VDDEWDSSLIKFSVKLKWNQYETLMLIERIPFEKAFWEINFKTIFYVYTYKWFLKINYVVFKGKQKIIMFGSIK